MRRAPNPWDRFYRFHEAPWRGERNVDALRPYLGTGRVLELGCGNGKALTPLRNAGFEVVGLDIAYHAVRRVDGLLADAAVLPFAEASFSAVLDIHCTGHLTPENRLDAVAEQFRVLQPGGQVIARRLGPNDLRASKGATVDGDDGTMQLDDGRTTHFTSETELQDMLRSAGFVVVSSESIVHHPRLRTERVTRENVQVVGRKPQDDDAA